MPSKLKLTIDCLSSKRSLKDTSLPKVALECLERSSKPPSYQITVKKSKVTFKRLKTDGPKGKKIKELHFKNAQEMFVSEKDKLVAFAVGKAKSPVCLALQFKEDSDLERFKAMATSSNPKLDQPRPKSPSGSIGDSPPSSSGDSVKPQRDNREQSPPSSPMSERSEKNKKMERSGRHEDDGVCEQCHQALPARVIASQVEYEPSIGQPRCYYYPTSRSYDRLDDERITKKRLNQGDGGYYRTDPSKKVIYPGNNPGRFRRSKYPARPRQRRRHSWSEASEYTFNKPVYITNAAESSSATSTTTAVSDVQVKEIGKVTCRTPQFGRNNRRPRSRTLIVRRDDQRCRRPKQPTTYCIYTCSDEEEEEDSDSFVDDSVSSYNDSEESVLSLRSRRIRQLLRELGKPGAVRLY